MLARRLIGGETSVVFVRGFSTAGVGLLQEAGGSGSGKRQHVRWTALSSAQPNSNNSQLKTSVKRMEELREKQSEEQTIDHSFVRQFQVGSTYDPFDFSMARLRLERLERRNATPTDRFKELKMDPLRLWKHPQELSDYISDSGRILPGYLHGHKKKTQKRLAKAIRRARAAGLLSPVHKHVETLGS